jgi:hypothetical protein
LKNIFNFLSHNFSHISNNLSQPSILSTNTTTTAGGKRKFTFKKRHIKAGDAILAQKRFFIYTRKKLFKKIAEFQKYIKIINFWLIFHFFQKYLANRITLIRASTMLLEMSMHMGQPRHTGPPGGGVKDLAARRATRQQQRILLQVIFF